MTSSVLFGIGAMLLWGGGDFLAGVASRGLGEKSAFFWIQTLMWLLILPVALFQGDSLGSALTSFTPADILSLTAIGFLQIAGYILFFRGMRIGPIGLVSALTSAWAALPVIISILFFQEKVNVLHGLLVILIFVGIFLAVGSWPAQWGQGVKEALLTLIIFGIVMTAIVPYAKRWGWFPPVFFLRCSMMFWSLCLLWKDRGAFPKLRLLPTVLMSAFFDFAAFLFYSGGMALNHVSVTAPISAAYPAVALLLAVIFLKEKLTLMRLVGVISIVLGVVGQSF